MCKFMWPHLIIPTLTWTVDGTMQLDPSWLPASHCAFSMTLPWYAMHTRNKPSKIKEL